MDTQLIDSIKTIVKNYLDSADLCDFLFGEVKSGVPASIELEANKLMLEESFLIIPKHLTDYEQEIEVEWDTDNGGSPAHSHPVSGTKKIKVKNALQLAERVILIRQQGGQKYLVIDRY